MLSAQGNTNNFLVLNRATQCLILTIHNIVSLKAYYINMSVCVI